MRNSVKLWYNKPAVTWFDALPIGTGRIAGLFYGTPERQCLSLNHEWLWRGQHKHREAGQQSQHLAAVRELLWQGNYHAANILGNDAFAGGGGLKQAIQPRQVDPYQPAGDLNVAVLINGTAATFESLYRELDVESATVTQKWQHQQHAFSQTVIADTERDQLLIHIACNHTFDLDLSFSRADDPECQLTDHIQSHSLQLRGRFPEGVEFTSQAQILATDGDCAPHEASLRIDQAKYVLIAVDVGCNARHTSSFTELTTSDSDPTTLSDRDWSAQLARHQNRAKSRLSNTQLNLPDEYDHLPTDKRIERVKKGQQDTGLLAIYFHYARYLLDACSATAELPANLQGKWNVEVSPPWQSDYHLDINLQMNYWPALSTGLFDANLKLLDYFERMVPSGKVAAKRLYNCNGIWFPLQTDVWAKATPESWGWAAWVGSAAWAAQHFQWHYQYTQDRDFLAQRAYPFFKQVALFYQDYLQQDSSGTWQILPSQSPENAFVGADNVPSSLCVSAAMDVQLAHQALTFAIEAATILNIDSDEQQQWSQIKGKLPTLQIGESGALLEWGIEVEEAEPGHRHLSHLIGIYPFDNLSPDQTPELWTAAKNSLKQRLSQGGGHTGWSRAWTACLWAHLGQGDRALQHLNHLIKDFSTSSLLDLHPPHYFQIDGNFGGAAAIVEMLLQSRQGDITLLPALPSTLTEGEVYGLHAKGGVVFDLKWCDSRLTKVIAHCKHSGVFTIRGLKENQSEPIRLNLEQGNSYLLVDEQKSEANDVTYH